MKNQFTLVLWPQSQIFMDEVWFSKEAILYQTINDQQDVEASAFFIPTKRIPQEHLATQIVDFIITEHNGEFVCEEQSCDMFLIIDGLECTVLKITKDTIVFDEDDDSDDIKLSAASIQDLAYIKHVLNN